MYPFHIQVVSLPSLIHINGYNLLNKIHVETGKDGQHNNTKDFRVFWSYGINFNLTLEIYF